MIYARTSRVNRSSLTISILLTRALPPGCSIPQQQCPEFERNIDHREGCIEVQRYGNCATAEFTAAGARCNYRCTRIYVSPGAAVNDAITAAELRAIYLTAPEQLLVSRFAPIPPSRFLTDLSSLGVHTAGAGRGKEGRADALSLLERTESFLLFNRTE